MQDFERNIASLLEALKFSPDNIPLKKHVAELLLQAGRTDEAIQHLKEVLALTEDYECMVRLGRAYYESEEFGEAATILERALSKQPTAEVYMLLSKIYFMLGNHQRAGDYYQDALSLDAKLEDKDYQEKLRSKGIGLRAGLSNADFSGSAIDEDIIERPTIRFAQVGGLDELKEHIKMNIIYPFQNPSLFRTYGKKIGGGILMYGPPGCGKTFIARATAGECNARFINIAINDILDMWIGSSEKNLHEVFELARRNTPAVLFIDELDAIGGSRQQMRFHHGRILTSQLLIELDGISSNNDEILVLGATNSPWFVDASLRRPGRFDRILFVPPPDLKARIEILQVHLKGKPLDTIDFERVARGMEKYSGADIRAVCEMAADSAIRDVLKGGKLRPIRTNDLLDGLKKVKASTLEWFSTAKNYATYSNQAGTYDEILNYLKRG
jgi:SpoVK/Ycf46/Vps4 family AAA+-type ATPase